MKNTKWKTAFSLYLYFFKIGWYTFGGGWSIIAQIQKDYVEKRGILKSEDLIDIVSVGRSIPGTMIGNVAYLFGYRLAGVPGAVLAVLGIVTPPLIILAAMTYCYTAVRDNVYINKALIGVRAVVAPVILSAVLKLHKGAFPQKFCFVLLALGCIGSYYFKISAIFLIAIGICTGLLFAKRKEEPENA